MKLSRKTLISNGVVAAAALVCALVSPRTVRAYSEEAVFILNPVTHPAVVEEVPHLASHLVTLWSGGASGAFVQIGTDGFQTGTPYVVPAGQSLVITSVDINGYDYDGGIVSIQSFAGGQYGVWTVPGHISTEIQFPSGIVVGSGTTLQAFTPVRGYIVYLRGYLTPG